ncbi:MAG: hypothetical protein PHU45_05330, partial [Bacilli bacterium]|nr:hypothetical protein [Bacilli bacterium]
DQSLSVRLSIIGVTKTEPSDLLNERILAQGGGKVAIEAKGDPDFSKVATSLDTGLYATEDEYGTSYYYRGTKELKNNLIWGGFQWKIVRINGDGSIRLIYNGTEAQFNINGTVNDTGEDTHIGTSGWNPNYDAKYAGYMYGGLKGAASTQRHGEISAAATYNETNSTIKVALDDWYEANILDKPFESDIIDNLFCNDRMLQSEVGGDATGPGYGHDNEATHYAACQRLNTTKNPSLKCGLKNDRFTTNDISIGNGALTHSVALLSADETAVAGLRNNSTNSNNYLYTNQTYWLFSPNVKSSADAVYMFCVLSTGQLNTFYTSGGQGVRPSLSISPSIEVSGEGSATDPFVVVTTPTLRDSILAQESGGPAMIEAKDTPDFNVINGTNGIYAAPDEYGMSYYYRGTKELKNNLIWGGFQWKIVRINGDGSIRLVYNGTEGQFISKSSVNDTGEETQIGTSPFNETYNDDAKYVGYMYGGLNGEASTQRNGLISTAATYNKTSSTVKGEIDSWYQTNILDKPFESQVVNNLFCNDRQLRSEIGGESTGLGYGTSATRYAAYHRLNTLNPNKTPTLKCGLQNDRYTTSTDTIIGNGALAYPIGLLTADELAMAGTVSVLDNNNIYLYTGQDWWSLSSCYYNLTYYSVVYALNSLGGLHTYGTIGIRGIRPSLSISSNVRVTGTGSANDPFKAI